MDALNKYATGQSLSDLAELILKNVKETTKPVEEEEELSEEDLRAMWDNEDCTLDGYSE